MDNRMSLKEFTIDSLRLYELKAMCWTTLIDINLYGKCGKMTIDQSVVLIPII